MKSRRITPGVPSKGWTLVLAGLATFMTALDTPSYRSGHRTRDGAVFAAAAGQ